MLGPRTKKIKEPLLFEGGGEQTYLDVTMQSAELADSDSKEEQKKKQTNYEMHINGLPGVSRKDRPYAFIVNGQVVLASKYSTFKQMDNNDKFRYTVVWLISQKWFDGFILLLIFANCVLMGMKDYLDRENKTPINNLIERLDPYFNTVIVLECVLKIIGLGFINGKGAYLRDGWNWLDFFVVSSTVIQETVKLAFPGGKESGFTAFRAVRLLRPLRLLGRIQSLKVMISTLIGSVQTLSGTMGLAAFFYLIFGILGITIWNGHIHYMCYTTETPVDGEWELMPDRSDICNPDEHASCGVGFYCGSRFEQFNSDGTRYAFNDPNLWKDTMTEELFWGFNNFDNIGFALLTIFQVTTMDGWTVLMNIYENAGSPTFSWFYYIGCVIICSFFIMNLTIAQMMMKYALVSDQSDVVDEFDKELYQIADRIFGPEHKKLADFIVQREYIEVDAKAKKYLKNKKSFWQSFAESQKVQIDQGHKYYNLGIVQRCLDTIQDTKFNKFMLLIILLNTLMLSLDKYPDYDQSVENYFSYLNIFFVFFFTMECILKVIGLGVRPFLNDGFNCFDFIVVLSSLQGIYFEYSGQKGSSYFLILRTLRVFRILKLFRIGDLRVLIDSITYTMPIILPYFVLLVFFMYIFALVGMSFYAGQIRFDENGNVDVLNGTSPREVYDTLGQSFLTIFQVLMGAEWRFIWYQHMMSCGMTAAFYYVLLIIIIGIIMLNLFLAIMLGNFDKARIFTEKKNVLQAFDELMNDKKRNKDLEFEEICDVILGCCSNHVKYDLLEMKRPFEQQSVLMKAFGKGLSKQVQEKGEQIHHDHRKKTGIQLEDGENDIFGHEQDLGVAQTQMLTHFQNSSFGIFHIDSAIRMFCLKLTEDKEAYLELSEMRKLVKSYDNGNQLEKELISSPKVRAPETQNSYFEANKIFDGLILVAIIISSLMLPLDNPLNDPNAAFSKKIDFLNEIFTVFFVSELTIKTVAKGVFSNSLNHIDPYLKSSWNQIDCFVVIVSVSDIMLEQFMPGASSQFSSFKALRALRALRPLRVIRSFPQLRKVVNAFFSSISAISNIVLIGVFILLIFAVIGVSLFKGKFYTCSETGVGIITKQDCLDAGFEWANGASNFDNVMQAMRTLFILTTTEGWAGVMYTGIDSAGVNKVQIQDNEPYMVIYFVGFMICGALFVMNMFVGVVIDNFNKEKDRQELQEEQDGSGDLKTFLVCQQIEKKKKVMQKKCVKPPGCRGPVYSLVHNPKFDQFIIFVVILNTIALSSKSYQMNHYLKWFLEMLNYVFAFIFNVEMFLKLISDDYKYFLNNWNLFDMFIVISADIGLILDFYAMKGSFKSVATVFRALRILRIAKLLKQFENIRVILDSVVVILPNISNVMCLFVLILYIYACIGIYMFAGAKRLAELNQYNNFSTFGRAMLGLTRYSTGEDFQEFMYEYSNTQDCNPNQTYEDIQKDGFQGCGSSLAIPYFMSFQVIAGWLVLNLTVAAVIDGLNEAQQNNDKLIRSDEIEEYLSTWQEYDPNQTFKMSMKNFFFFLAELKAPFIEFDGFISTNLEDNEPGWLVNPAKGYKVNIYKLFTLVKGMKIPIELENKEAFMKFEDITKAIVFRTFKMDKDKKNISSLQTTTVGLKEGSKKNKIQNKKKKAILNIFQKNQGSKGEVDVDLMMIRYLAATILQQFFRQNRDSLKGKRNIFNQKMKQKFKL